MPKRVLFVCLGNACRSQMAEGFARALGDDVLASSSAGIAPAMRVMPDTMRAMAEKGIDLKEHFPKTVAEVRHLPFDLVINMSGCELPSFVKAPARDWDVPDPVFMSYSDHCIVRDEIERRVAELIEECRHDSNGFRRRGAGNHS